MVTVRIRPVGRWLLPHSSWAIWEPTCRRALLDDLAVSNARFQRIGKELQSLRELGTVSRGLAEIVEKAGSQWGLPNGYVLGQEAGGAMVAGLRYGEGILYTKN